MRFAFCADNLFADTQYVQQVPVGDQEPVGFEAYRVGVGRRHVQNRWQPTTANADHTLTVNCQALVGGVVQPVPRGANFLAIDRASNLLGTRIQLLGSDDNFATFRTVLDLTLPTVPGGAITGPLGCVTDEGAWLIVFPTDVHNDWRFVSKAMGAGLVPKITNLTLGFAWIQAVSQMTAAEDESFAVGMTEQETDAGWVGSTRGYARREGTLSLVFPIGGGNPTTDYDLLRYQVLGLYARKQRAWLLMHYDDSPWRALYVRCPKGKLPWASTASEPGMSRLVLPFQESEPQP